MTNRFSLKKLRLYLIDISASVIRVSLVLAAIDFILGKITLATTEALEAVLSLDLILVTVIFSVLLVTIISLEILFLIGVILLIASDKSWSNFWKGHTNPSDTQ